VTKIILPKVKGNKAIPLTERRGPEISQGVGHFGEPARTRRRPRKKGRRTLKKTFVGREQRAASPKVSRDLISATPQSVRGTVSVEKKNSSSLKGLRKKWRKNLLFSMKILRTRALLSGDLTGKGFMLDMMKEKERRRHCTRKLLKQDGLGGGGWGWGGGGWGGGGGFVGGGWWLGGGGAGGNQRKTRFLVGPRGESGPRTEDWEEAGEDHYKRE